MKILYNIMQTFENFNETLFLARLKLWTIRNQEKVTLKRKGEIYHSRHLQTNTHTTEEIHIKLILYRSSRNLQGINISIALELFYKKNWKAFHTTVLKWKMWAHTYTNPEDWFYLLANIEVAIYKAPLGFSGGSDGKHTALMQETQVQSLSWKDPLEKGLATHSSILAWRIPWTEGTWRGTVYWVAKSWTQLSN